MALVYAIQGCYLLCNPIHARALIEHDENYLAEEYKLKRNCPFSIILSLDYLLEPYLFPRAGFCLTAFPLKGKKGFHTWLLQL